MASEALSSIRSSLARWQPLDLNGSAQVLPLGISALDAALPGGGLPMGAVTELQVRGSSGIATSFALAVCRAAQSFHRNQLDRSQNDRSQNHRSQNGREPEGNQPWCAFIDPSASLFAPGVARMGVELSRLLVARPSADAIDRVAVRIAETNLMAALIIDLRCSMLPSSMLSSSMLPSSMLPSSISSRASMNEHSWQRTVRRLSLAIKSSSTSVLLLTRAEQFQSLPLPAFQRLELTRSSPASFQLKIAKERTGRISPSRIFPCSIFDLASFAPSASTAPGVVGCRSAEAPEHEWETAQAGLTRKVS